AQSRIETQILNQIQNLKEKVSTDELRIVSQIESDSNRFLLARKELERKNHVSSSDILQMREALEAALDSVGTFIESDLNLATQTSKRAEKIDLLTDIMGAILIVIFIFGFAVIIFLSRNYLYRPLSQIKNTLSQFSHGDRSARAKIQGARELRAIGSVYNEMAEDLEELERRRFEFLAGVVHDLRNPLSA
ncbi:MAG: HAMP domain-containing protein, partial [Bdellovibrionia bacterium]